MILDAHAHFWDPAARHHDWLHEHPLLLHRFGPEDLDAGRHALGGVVFVQADCRDDEALSEVQWVADLARTHPLVRGIVAFAPLECGAAVEHRLAALTREPLVVGVRRLLQGEPVSTITDPSLEAGVRQLARHGLPFDLCVTHDQLPAIAGLVEACPGTSFVLDHLGKPPVAAGLLDPWRADIARLAAAPNVVCKLSGLATEAAAGAWRPAELRPYLDHALQVFGPGRCLVGSDWPVVTLRATVEAWFDLVLQALEEFSEAERQAVLVDNAVAVYGLPTSSIDRPGSMHASGDVHR